MPTTWRIYGKETLACRLERCDLPGLFRKKIVVGPGEAALILRDGEIDAVLTESSAEVADPVDQLASLLKLGADIAVFFVEVSPWEASIFVGETAKGIATADAQMRSTLVSGSQAASVSGMSSAIGNAGWTEDAASSASTASVRSGQRFDVSELSIVALSADKEVIQAECRLRLHVNPEDPARFMGLLKGKRALATWDVAALLRDEFFARVLIPEIAKRQSTELRGDGVLVNSIEKGVFQKLEGTLRAFWASSRLVHDFMGHHRGGAGRDRSKEKRTRGTGP